VPPVSLALPGFPTVTMSIVTANDGTASRHAQRQATTAHENDNL